jgi:hypothetical protein
VNGVYRVAKMADWPHPHASVCKALAMLKAYFDESGIHEGSSVTALAGFVATKDSWVKLEPKWQGVLSEYADRGVRFFHMTDALAQRGQFARIDKPNLNYMLTQLSEAVGASGATAISSAVVVKDWKAVVKDPDFLKRFPAPLDLCFENLVENLALWARQHAGGEPVCPVFAYQKEFSPRMADLGRVYGAQDWYRTVLGAIAFDFPDRTIPLQAADLLVHQMNWDITKRRYGPHDLASGGPTVVLHKATGGKFIYGNWFDAAALQLTVKRFKETGHI